MIEKETALLSVTGILVFLLLVLFFGFMLPVQNIPGNWFEILSTITLGAIFFGVFLSGYEKMVTVEQGYQAVVLRSQRIVGTVPSGIYWPIPFHKVEKVSTKEDASTKELILVTLGDQVKVKMSYGYAFKIYDPEQYLKIDVNDAFTIINGKMQMIIDEIFSNPERPLYAIKIKGEVKTSENNVLNMLDEIRDTVIRDLTSPAKNYGGWESNGWIRFPEYGIEIGKVNISGGQLIDDSLVKEIAIIMKEKLQREAKAIEIETLIGAIKKMVESGSSPEFAAYVVSLVNGYKVDGTKFFGLLGDATGADALLFGEGGGNLGLLLNKNNNNNKKGGNNK